MLSLCTAAASAQFAVEVEVPLMIPQVGRPAPARPSCEADQLRLGCSSSDCLRHLQEQLSPPCLQLLSMQDAIQPSPQPFSFEFEEWGSGSAGVIEMSADIPPELASLLSMLPGFPSSMFGSSMLGRPPRPQPPPPSEEPATHPCEREINLCTEETHSTKDLQGCLVRHLDQVNPRCKCFLHHMLGDSLLEKTPAPAEPRAQLVDIVVVDVEEVPPRRHHAACLMSSLLFFVVVFFLARCCIRACITKPRFAAVVEPATVTIKTVPGVVEYHVEPLTAPKMAILVEEKTVAA